MARALGGRILLLALIWWALAEGRMDAWAFGAPLVLAAALLSLRLSPPMPYPLRPLGLLRFSGYFLMQSLRAGLDVARRTLHPRLPLKPALFEFPSTLPAGLPRALLANTLSLLPGSLTVHLDERRLLLHVLDRQAPVAAEFRRAERMVAGVFGLPGEERP